MTEGMASVEDDRALAFRHDRSAFIARYRALSQPLDIHIDQHHAMRMKAFEIRIDQSLGDGGSGRVGKADGTKQPRDKDAEMLSIDINHSIICHWSAASAGSVWTRIS